MSNTEAVDETPLNLATVKDITAEFRRRGLHYVLLITEARDGQVYEHTNIAADVMKAVLQIAIDQP